MKDVTCSYNHRIGHHHDAPFMALAVKTNHFKTHTHNHERKNMKRKIKITKMKDVSAITIESDSTIEVHHAHGSNPHMVQAYSNLFFCFHILCQL